MTFSIVARDPRTGSLGDLAGSGAEVRSLIADRPSWETIVRSFAAKGLMAIPPGTTIDSILDPD